MSTSQPKGRLRHTWASTKTPPRHIHIDEFYKRQVKRQLTLLNNAHMADRLDFVEAHYESDHDDAAHADEKMFVCGKGRKWKYVRHDIDGPAFQFVTDNKLHAAQLMVTVWSWFAPSATPRAN